jgi:1,4-alpha-glucan branching enzyme
MPLAARIEGARGCSKEITLRSGVARGRAPARCMSRQPVRLSQPTLPSRTAWGESPNKGVGGEKAPDLRVRGAVRRDRHVSHLIIAASWMAALSLGCGGRDPEDAEADEAISGVRGIGAIVHDQGTLFRVWAPGAVKVFISAELDGWGRREMIPEANGYFALDVPGASPGQMYKYVLTGADGREVTTADPRAQRMKNSASASIIHDPSSYRWTSGAFSPPPLDRQVIYEMHVGTFHDAPGGKPGTWASAIEKLDDLRDLGINMIELLPIFEFPGDYSWGYNPSFLYAPESIYGPPDDLKRFIDEAHARGIGIIYDVVHNHYGNDFPRWCFSESCAASGSPYYYGDARRVTPWGATRPDYANKQVRSFIRDQMRLLLREYRASGLRWDATKFIRTVDGSQETELPEAVAFLRNLNATVDAEAPGVTMIAEDLGGGDFVTRPVDRDGLGFGSQWTTLFSHVLRTTLAPASDVGRDLDAVSNAIAAHHDRSALERVIYVESHDEVSEGKNRFTEAMEGAAADSWTAKKKSTLAASIVLTAPGIPMIFQGQELLEDGHFSDTDPVDWQKAERFSGIVSLYRDLIRLRRNEGHASCGLTGDGVAVFHTNRNAKVIAYHRWKLGGPGDDVIVLANLSGRAFASYAIGLPSGGTWKTRFNSDARRYSSDFAGTPSGDVAASAVPRDGLPFRGALGLGPYSLVVLSQDP